MTAIRTSKLLVIVLFLAASAAWASSGDDGIDLRCNKVAGTGDVALQWTNGLTPFSVFRSTNVTDVTTPASYLGQTAGSSWVDTPPAGSLYFYFIAGSCNYAPPEICDGLDNDCDPGTPDGSEDPALGAPCDGADSDLCAEGVTACSSGALKCSDGSASTIDVCDGADNDCDASSSDGSEDPLVGTACDGADSDLCAEGTRFCSGGVLACSDATGSTVDLCDGVDNDCDASSADGSEDPQVGTACDGADSDLCAEGTRFCSGGVLACSDATGSTVDICDGVNNDCDASSADGSEDPQVGTACDGADGDLCLEGTRFCSGGALACSDVTGTTTELCAGNGVDEDCDGSVDEGFVRDDNPVCSPPVFLGSVSGDTGTQTLQTSFYNEEWRRLTIREDSGGFSSIYLSARIQLFSPPGTDFDLYVYCVSCGGTLAGSSTSGGMSGHTDSVDVRADDDLFSDDTFDVIIEIRHFSSTLCANWQLDVTGDLPAASATCN